MISPEKMDMVSTLSLHAASGLSLGMSVVVLGDVLPWKWADRRPWVVAALLIALWLPFVLSGDSQVRRAGATAVSLYLAGLFVAYNRRVGALQVAAVAEARERAVAAAVASFEHTEHTCPVRMRGNCVPAPRIPVDDMIGEE